MQPFRRQFLKNTLVLFASAWFAPVAHALWPAESFKPNLLEATLKQLFNGKAITPTDKIDIKIPLIAENGAVVPITVTSSLPAVQKIYLLVEKNPIPLAAVFALSESLQAFVSARLKMAETCDVWVVAETADALFSAKANVKVTIGGCGG
jgi:sulfur-oxidizing protein SoxY